MEDSATRLSGGQCGAAHRPANDHDGAAPRGRWVENSKGAMASDGGPTPGGAPPTSAAAEEPSVALVNVDSTGSSSKSFKRSSSKHFSLQRSSESSGASSTVAPEDQGGSTKERRPSRNNRRKSRVSMSQGMSIKRRVFGGGASVAHDDSDDEFDFESELTPVAKKVKKPWRIDPMSKAMGNWDLTTVVLLIFTATVTPYEVGFLQTKINLLFMINRVVDLCFMTDMVINFFVPYQDMFGNWVHELDLIAAHYLRGWFFIDLVSIVPYDILKFLLNSDSLTNLKVLRVIRLIRLFKLLRVLRAGRMFSRWESRVSINYAMLNLYGFIVSLVIICHWLACAWGVMINIDSLINDEPNWIDEYEYLSMGDSASRKYLAALYWAIATVTTLSYGDIVPHTDAERCFIIFAMAVGGALYAYIIGGVCGVLAGLNARSAEFHKPIPPLPAAPIMRILGLNRSLPGAKAHALKRLLVQKMDTLNQFLREKMVDESNPGLCARLRDFYRFRHEHGNLASDSAKILSNISPSLRGEVANTLHEHWLQNIVFFKGARIVQDFYVRIALALNTHLFSPREAIFLPSDIADKLHVLERGLVAIKGIIMHRGDCFGHEVFYRQGVVRNMKVKNTGGKTGVLIGTPWGYSAMTLSHGMELWLNADDLNNILNRKEFLNVKKHTRRVVVRMQTRDTIRRMTGAIRAAVRKRTFDDGLHVLKAELGVSCMKKLKAVTHLYYTCLRTTEEIKHLEKVALILQRYIRKKQFIQQASRKYRIAQEDVARAKALYEVNLVLGKVKLPQYRDLLIRHRVTSLQIFKACTAAELTLIGIPLGDAKTLVAVLPEVHLTEDAASPA